MRWLAPAHTPWRCGLTIFGLLSLFLMIDQEIGRSEPLVLSARSRVETTKGSGQWQEKTENLSWDPTRTAIVVCDMWDQHWCQGATRRVAEMAPRMNEVLKAARARGVFIIHCPSDTMKFYEGTPGRMLAQSAPKAASRPEGWRSLDPTREPPLPIDDSDGGCDDWPQCRQHGPWKRQIATLEIQPGDAITDSDEAYNLMMARGITNVMVMGVHLNMCVLGRPFSIRQMVLHGQNVVVMRDMTDTMYNSRMPPFVSHFAGTDLVTEHIEKYWCPSVTSVALLGGEPFRFRDDHRPRVLFVIGEDEYHTWETLPDFAQKELSWRGFDVEIIKENTARKNEFVGLTGALGKADLLVLSLRRRALPKEQLDAIRNYLAAGKPLVGLRTTSHAFAPQGRDVDPASRWDTFDPEVLGGHYSGHHGSGKVATIRVADGAAKEPLLTGVQVNGFVSKGSLYKASPLAPDAQPLLTGSIPGQPEEPVAWIRTYGPKSARVFYTSLGHPEDFKENAFRRLLLNGMLWVMKQRIPPEPAQTAVIEKPVGDTWQAMTVPGTWEEMSPENALKNYDGIAWYRCLVRAPADWADRDWQLLMEKVDNAYDLFFDGERIGSAGRFPPNYVNGIDAKSEHAIPAALRRPGQWQLVAVRVYDADGRGGFKGAPPALRCGDRVIALAGEWQFRTGDDSSLPRLAAGETLSSHLFHDVTSLQRFTSGEYRERIAPGAQPLSPEESARKFTVVDGLEMGLVLHEPEIAQPLQISFDERGRMWLVEYRQYPEPAGLTLVSHDQFWRAVYDKVPPPPPNHFKGKDRVSIHEDTDGDGTYDRHSVFVDGLNIATAAVCGRGGVWVLNPPYLLFYPDADGDDVPDRDPEVHLEGFGLEDTHSVVNSLRWGPDGWLYAAQGSTVSGRVRAPAATNEPVQILGQNIWRYDPARRRYEVFAEGGGNAFGVEIDDAGRIFSGHNGGNTRGFHYVQGGYLQKGFEKHGQLSNPYAFGYYPPMKHPDVERFTHTFVIYGGGALDGKFAGRLFGIEPLQGRVVMSDITREGSTFRTRDVGYAVTSADPWFKPVDIKQGPDGALYIADWYDFQVNHWRNYQGNMDAGNGRVYRLKAAAAKGPPLEDLRRVPSARLVELLSHANRWTRQMAVRLLGERRDPSVVPLLEAGLWSEGKRQTSLEALWALHWMGGFSPSVATRALMSENSLVREWTVRLLGDSDQVSPELGSALVQLATREPEIDVRLQLAATARRLPVGQALPILQALMRRDEDSSDPRQPLMVWWGLEAHCAADRKAIVRLLDEESDWLRPMMAGTLLERIARRFASAGSPEDLTACAELLRRAPDAGSRSALVQGIELAFQNRSLAGLPQSLVSELAKAGGGSLALQLRMGREGALERALAVVVDEKGKNSSRTQIIQTLGEQKEPRAMGALLQAVDSKEEPVRLAALSALQVFDAPEIASRLLRGIASAAPQTRNAALLLLASRPGWSMEIIRAVEAGELPTSAVSPDIVRQIKRHKGEGLADRVAALWPQSGRPTSAEMENQIMRLAAVVRGGSGDPYNGKKLYNANCGACHRLFDAGGMIGPDLTPFRRDDLDTLLLSIVNPSAEMREGYENYLVDTKDDRSLSGFVIRQDEDAVILRGVDGQDVVLRRAEILELRPAGMSLMPEGLLDGLDDQQLRDLLAYVRSSQPLAN